MSTKWNSTPITSFIPEKDMQILCILKNHYRSKVPLSKQLHKHTLLRWDRFIQKWTDDTERPINSEDVLFWKKLFPLSGTQINTIHKKIHKQKE